MSISSIIGLCKKPFTAMSSCCKKTPNPRVPADEFVPTQNSAPPAQAQEMHAQNSVVSAQLPPSFQAYRNQLGAQRAEFQATGARVEPLLNDQQLDELATLQARAQQRFTQLQQTPNSESDLHVERYRLAYIRPLNGQATIKELKRARKLDRMDRPTLQSWLSKMNERRSLEEMRHSTSSSGLDSPTGSQ